MEQLMTLDVSPTYLGWFDPDKKKPAQKKLKDALAQYRLNYRREATIVLVSQGMVAELKAPDGVQITGRRDVQPNTFYVG